MRSFLLCLALGALAACDTGAPDPTASAATVHFDWSDQIRVVNSCDFPTSNPGEFTFRVTLDAMIGGETSTLTVMDREADAGSGSRVAVSDDATAFTVPRDGSASFTVHFFARERDLPDYDIDETASLDHAFEDGQLTPRGDHSLSLTDGSGCHVRLDYSVAVS